MKMMLERALFVALLCSYPVVNAECDMPQSWYGEWFHSGFPTPVRVDRNGISVKGECVQRGKDDKNMFLIKVSESRFGSCYQCMMIYEKHYNVLLYKESYCEEDPKMSMSKLCNTIPGDAPLYTMFRKDGDLIKCPFKGPFSFAYTKGATGQVCKYPNSYMDSCYEHRKMKLKYQACLDVEGSEIATEEMSCLAKWKEGSSWYLVALLNGTHIRTDEARYKCFLYQRHRDSQNVVYKMSQSDKASCVGLWSVDEGVKTFTMKKLEPEGPGCEFPSWLGRHHDWMGADSPDETRIHINKRGHSFKMINQSVESHVTCHSVKDQGTVAKVVAHVKNGCDSGYVCMIFHSRDQHVIQMRYGGQSRDPSEACMNYYFDPLTSPETTLVASGHHNTRPCPFSGRYSLVGSRDSLINLLEPTDTLITNCANLNVIMQAGCSDSADLQVEAHCQTAVPVDTSYNNEVMNDAPSGMNRLRSEFTCHGKWTEPLTVRNHYVKRSVEEMSTTPISRMQPVERHFIMLSTGHDSKRYICLTYVEQDGVLLASTSSCSSSVSGAVTKSHFNITSSGPCLQALTGGAHRTKSVSVLGISLSLLFALTLANNN